MKQVVLARIDDRLIHGQVITAWLKHIQANSILIVDDALAKNSMMSRIYRAAAPSNIDLFIHDYETSLEFLKSDDKKHNKVVILTKTPQIYERLINDGVQIPTIVLGGMGSNQERKQFIKNVFASEEEVSSLSRMCESNIKIVYQLVPDDKETDIKSILSK